MKYKNILLIALVLIILTTWAGAVSASDDIGSDELSVDENLNTESSDIGEVNGEDSGKGSYDESSDLIGKNLEDDDEIWGQTVVMVVKTSTSSSSASSGKAASKLTVKKATFKTKAKTKKFSVTLKSGSKAIKKVKVYLKIGKKTYKAKTNSKGKATFRITKLTKKGTYKGTVKFKGNSKYKAVTKKLKVSLSKTKCTIKAVASSNDNFVDASGAFKSLNAFRTSAGVWYWNKGDTTKTYFNTAGATTLKALSWDSALEKTAKIRAKEIAKSFSHTRPDGSSCWTVYPKSYTAVGENIAMGTHLSGEKATELWKEDNYKYNGQGHRRNMLDPMFNCVGIAGFEKDGYVYWVQCFGRK